MKIISNKVQWLRNNIAMYLRRNLSKKVQLILISQQLQYKRNNLNRQFKLNNSTQKNIINKHEKTMYSQNGEDGIIEYIFSQIGTTNKVFVEIGIGDGTENNTTYLIRKQWKGLLIDQTIEYLELATFFYKQLLGTNFKNIKLIHHQAKKESVDECIKSNISGEIDLLSIDIDGNDYWIWEAIVSIKPRVVVIEYNAQLGVSRSISTVYDPDFYCGNKHPSNLYHGASLSALAKLGATKGYSLVGCDSSGTNAFFVLRNLITNTLPALSSQEAYFPNYYFSKELSMDEQFKIIKHLPFKDI